MKKSVVLTQKQRRIRIVWYYLCLLLYPILLFVSSKILPSGITSALSGTFVLFMMAGSRLLRSLGYRKEDLLEVDPKLDERQQFVLYKAYRMTFYVTFVLIAVVGAIALISFALVTRAPENSGDSVDPFLPTLAGLLFLMMAHFTLPAAMILWLEPDPPVETEMPNEPRREGIA